MKLNEGVPSFPFTSYDDSWTTLSSQRGEKRDSKSLFLHLAVVLRGTQRCQKTDSQLVNFPLWNGQKIQAQGKRKVSRELMRALKI